MSLPPTTAVPPIGEENRIRLAPGVILRHDRTRGQWMLMAAERLLVLDDTALAVIRAATGPEAGTVGQAVDRLAVEYDAPRGEIAADVLELLTDLRNKGYVTP
ncbi:pyrroloquinoline quinone biosynthesis peptide chaperone PqqD [Azospirillum thermophilum]|uniref:Pyrroloquinoline quinone biosynthesis peptide chaperone PqqD n=1 Tax=Azospirillum thermophilum TaxID=2202148 RepID=A0A2S2CZ83_9PROT|nr:pyrroloquinoline quinone biosynthesis peptide chaperone PqqD [Azospirillum thermophilum]AWK89690.1 pyrroloquinoline quinone biosynthesis peptide chaperone PqqD [Azospirillum thermophilum]